MSPHFKVVFDAATACRQHDRGTHGSARSFRQRKSEINGGQSMRDIRDDLQDRANSLKEQMGTAQVQFEKQIDQMKQEHANRLKGLKDDLDAVTMLLGAEQRRHGDKSPAPKTQPRPQEPSAQQKQPGKIRPRMPLAEMLGLQRAS
jgi:hypothetical protein